MSRWYRAYEGTVTDAKLGEAAMIAECSRSVAIAAWHCLLESAATKNNCGSYEATARRVAVILCEPVSVIEALVEAFAELGMVRDGAISSWRKRQYQSDDSAPRVAKYRQKKRLESANVTPCNGGVTPPDTETDTERGVSNETLVGKPTPSAVPELKPEHVVEAWNDLAGRYGFSRAKLTPERQRKLKTRIRHTSADDFTEAISAFDRSSFLRGENDRGWKPNLDWLLEPKNFTKVQEGAYDR